MDKRAISYGGTDTLGRAYERLRKRSYRKFLKSEVLRRALSEPDLLTEEEFEAAFDEWHSGHRWHRWEHEMYVAGVRDALAEVGG